MFLIFSTSAPKENVTVLSSPAQRRHSFKLNCYLLRQKDAADADHAYFKGRVSAAGQLVSSHKACNVSMTAREKPRQVISHHAGLLHRPQETAATPSSPLLEQALIVSGQPLLVPAPLALVVPAFMRKAVAQPTCHLWYISVHLQRSLGTSCMGPKVLYS